MSRPLRLIAVVVAASMLVSLPAAVAGGASTEGCDLFRAGELERVLGVAFTAEPVGADGCYWLSEDEGLAEVVVRADRSHTAADIELGKESVRDEPGAKVLKKVGDLAVLTPSPTTSPTDVTTLALVVFVDTDFGQLSVTLSETAPTTKQMRRLGKLLAKRL